MRKLVGFAILLLSSMTASLTLAGSIDNSNKALKIAVIGAGPSGLVAAAELKASGFDNVKVFESASDVGGKVKSINYKGFTYEMGAVITSPDYDIVFKIAHDLKIPLVATPETWEISPDGKVRSYASPLWDQYDTLDVLSSVYYFRQFVDENRKFFEPGFAYTPWALFTTYENFMTVSKVQTISELFRPVMVGCGYGFAEDMPAPYWMKLMKTFAYDRTSHSVSFSSSAFFQAFPQGWQDLWRRFADNRELDIAFNTEVSRVTRYELNGQPVVEVEAKGQKYLFDRVIISVPHLAYRFLDLDEKEAEIFSRVLTIPYKTTLLEIDGLPTNAHLFPRAYSTKYDQDGLPNDGNVVLLSNNQGTNVYQAYQFTQDGKSSSELLRILKNNITRMQGRIKKVVAEEVFDYFPHFDVEGFIDGVPQTLAGLQGKGGVYYTGALMNFETVELSAKHARRLVEDHFRK